MQVNSTAITSSDGEEFIVHHKGELDQDLKTALEESTADEIRVLFIKLGFKMAPVLVGPEVPQ